MTDPAGAPPLTVAAVARRLGVAAATLRSWERRYGMGPTGRVAGARRRYTPADVARLEQMRRLTLDGVAPADAAQRALADPGVPGPAAERSMPTSRGAMVELAAARSGGPGGRVLALPRADARARGLSRAAFALDCDSVRAIVGSAVADHGVITAWELLCVPVLRAIGDRWAATGEGVEVEHLLAEAMQTALQESVPPPADPHNARPVLAACMPGEQHGLPLHALTAALAERGVSARVLGAALPADALAAAVRRTGPAVVFLWAQAAETADAAAVRALPTTRPPAAVVVGGPGWDPVRAPASATFAADLRDAVHLVQLAVGTG